MMAPEVMEAINIAVAAAIQQSTAAYASGLPQIISEAMKAMKRDNDDGNRMTEKVGDFVEKLTKRTSVFGGDSFQEWKFKTEVGMKAVSELLGNLAKDSEAHMDGPISRSATGWLQERLDLDNMLYYFLTAVTKGEAFDLIKNAGDGSGAEAWRKLCKGYGGRSKGKRVVSDAEVRQSDQGEENGRHTWYGGEVGGRHAQVACGVWREHVGWTQERHSPRDGAGCSGGVHYAASGRQGQLRQDQRDGPQPHRDQERLRPHSYGP